MINKDEVLRYLDYRIFYKGFVPSLRENGKTEAMGLCPFHDDHNPSLSVNLEKGLWNCLAGCGGGSVFDFYMKIHGVDFKVALAELSRMAGIIEEPKRKIFKTYDYVDESDKLLFQVVRYEPKHFNQRRPDGKGGWIWNLEGVKPVLYNLPEVLKADKADMVFIVEGEKDVDNLRRVGFIATTNSGGARKWKDEYNHHLKGKEIIIIPDEDKGGRDHALEVANSLYGMTKSIKIISLSGLSEKGDISDWLDLRDAKNTEDIRVELLSLIEATPDWIPPKELELLSSLLRWNDISGLNTKTDYLLDKLIPKGSITLLFGRGGIGKTSLCLQIGRTIAEGIPFGDLQSIKTPVYYIDFENPLSVLQQRIKSIGPTDNLWIWHICNTPQPPRLDSKEWELYKQLPPGLLIVDTLRAAHLLNENDSQDMAVVIARLKELREIGFTILLLHHTPKGNEGIYKGSTALLDLVDHVLGIESIKDIDEEPIEFDPDNLYRLGVRIKTRYEPHHVFLKFSPDIKGFEFAKDPAIEKIETLYEILREAGQLMQKDFKERAKAELDLTEGEVRKLLKKGKGLAWDVEKGGYKNRALNYLPKSNRIIGRPLYSQPINQLDLEGDKELSNYIASDSPQTLDTLELDNKIKYIQPINQLEIEHLEGNRIIGQHYRGHPINQLESRGVSCKTGQLEGGKCASCIRVEGCRLLEGQRPHCGGPFLC